MSKLVTLLTLAGVGALVALRRSRARRDEEDLWSEATSAPDLR